MAARPNTHRRNVRAVTPISTVGRNVASAAIAAGLVFGGGALASADEAKPEAPAKGAEAVTPVTAPAVAAATAAPQVKAQTATPTSKIPAVQVKAGESFGSPEVPVDQIKVKVPSQESATAVATNTSSASQVSAASAERPATRAQASRSQEASRSTERPAVAEKKAATPAAPPAVASNSIIATAMSGTGVPYVWGGTSRSGWDCSGFVQWVFRQHGINLPRVASAQAAAGRRIPASEARPGDLMYKPGHIAIYAGNGMLIDAGNKRVGTSYRKIFRASWSYHRVTK